MRLNIILELVLLEGNVDESRSFTSELRKHVEGVYLECE